MSVFFFVTLVIKPNTIRYGGVSNKHNPAMSIKKRLSKRIKIIEAALHNGFDDSINDIETLSYYKDGQVFTDRFDYIDKTTTPVTVRFIGGTGHDDVKATLGSLTNESLDRLYRCIAKCKK